MPLKINRKNITVFAAILGVVFLMFLAAQKLYSEFVGLRIEKGNVAQQIIEESKILEELKNIDAAAGENEFEKVSAAIPDEEGIPGFIKQLNSLTTKYALNLVSVNPLAEAKGYADFDNARRVKARNVQVKLLGTQNNFNSFLKALESAARFTNIDSIEVVPDRDKISSLFNVVLTIYYY